MTEVSGHRTPARLTLVDVLESAAERRANEPAYTFWSDEQRIESWTFGELARRARAIAVGLSGSGSASGDAANGCVLLVYPPGLDFIAAFFGCIYAGRLPVPAVYPKPRRPMPRLLSIARDCGASLALSNTDTLDRIHQFRSADSLPGIRWLASDAWDLSHEDRWQPPDVSGTDLALLQYTSGSTSDPKGVMVSHGNLLHNLEMIRRGFSLGDERQTGVFWLPAYHDMGLIGGILEPLYVAGHSVLMSPQAFLQRPERWLTLISRYRAAISGAPNFAYQMCARRLDRKQFERLDLSCWKVAFCGAEPISADTLEEFAEALAPSGFRADAYYPCYGLAEATLLAAGGQGPARPVIEAVDRVALSERRFEPAGSSGAVQRLVGCGKALLDQQLQIVDPGTGRPCPPGRVGEIWLRGASVAQGYWHRPQLSAEVFAARLADGDGPYLRTGDLGALHAGQLFITGRLKDVLVVRGRNYYPQDIEQLVEQLDPELHGSAGCAFTLGAPAAEADELPEERLVVLHEVQRHRRDDLERLARRIRREIAAEFDLDVHAVVLVRRASLPRTTSGKIQRQLCRDAYRDGRLKVLAQWVHPGARPPHEAANGRRHLAAARSAGRQAGQGAAPPSARLLPPPTPPQRPLTGSELDQLAEQIQAFMLAWLRERAGIAEEDLDPHRSFADMGLDSLTAVELSQQLEDALDVRLTAVVAWNYPTPAAMARYLAQQHRGEASASASGEGGAAADEFEKMLAEIEAMSDGDAQRALEQRRLE